MARASALIYLSLCFSVAFCGERPASQQACGQDRRACVLFEEPAPLSLVQSHAAGIAAKGAATGATHISLLQQKELAAGGGGAGFSASGAHRAGARAPGAKVGGAQLAIWAVVAAILLGIGALLGAGDEAPATPKYVSEFVGTFMLVFSVGCNVLVGDPTWGIVAIACTLMVSIYALGGVSGGHFNPAVSCAVALCGKMPPKRCGAYVCTQLAAGIAAGLAYGLMLSETFRLGPSDGFSAMQAGLAEVFYTFMLCFVVLNSAVAAAHAGKDQFYGLAIGFSVVAGGYGAGSISGGCFNPAVAVGIDSSASAQGFGWCLVYFAFEVVGAALAALLFRACRPGDFAGGASGEEPKLATRCLSEFLGTFMLVLTVGLNVLASSPAAVFSIAASLMCMIFALGSVSGAHFNPAVTFAIFLSGREKTNLVDSIAYIISQVTAGIAAGLIYVAMENGRSVALKPSAGTSEALTGELVFTFLLSFVVLSVATVRSPLSQYFGLAIGSCVTAGGLAIGSLSGGSLNPAVSAGLALSDVANGGSLASLPSYALVELAGGALAAAVFRGTHASEYAAK